MPARSFELYAFIVLILIMVISGIFWWKNRSVGDTTGFRLTSKSLMNNEPIPIAFTCDGANINPAFEILEVPEKAQSLAILMEDLDLDGKIKQETSNFAHWMAWNIPPTTNKITEGIRPPGTIGRNLYGNFAYAGPCPPEGEKHTYIFRLYALKKEIPGSSSDSTFEKVRRDIEKNDMARSTLKVTYERPKK